MKLFVTDYDKTFLVPGEDISRNIEMARLWMKKNIFVIATGRSYKDFMEEKVKYNIPYHYVILNHGATILKGDEVVKSVKINRKICLKLASFLKVDKAKKAFGCYEKESRIVLFNYPLSKIYINYGDSMIAKNVVDIIKSQQLKINTFLVDRNMAVEIINIKANKSTAIEVVADLEKINIDDIYTIGDNYNDLEMIRMFHGYSLPTSLPEIKKISEAQVRDVASCLKELLAKEIE